MFHYANFNVLYLEESKAILVLFSILFTEVLTILDSVFFLYNYNILSVKEYEAAMKYLHKVLQLMKSMEKVENNLDRIILSLFT